MYIIIEICKKLPRWAYRSILNAMKAKERFYQTADWHFILDNLYNLVSLNFIEP